MACEGRQQIQTTTGDPRLTHIQSRNISNGNCHKHTSTPTGSHIGPNARSFRSTRMVPITNYSPTDVSKEITQTTNTTPGPHHRHGINSAYTRPDQMGNPRFVAGTIWTQQRLLDGWSTIPPHTKPLPHLYLHSTDTQTVWGHDHDGAYRQLPLQDPEMAYVLLQTPQGPMLWHYHVLLFGSAASVWAYNRFGDMLTHVSRRLYAAYEYSTTWTTTGVSASPPTLTAASTPSPNTGYTAQNTRSHHQLFWTIHHCPAMPQQSPATPHRTT